MRKKLRRIKMKRKKFDENKKIQPRVLVNELLAVTRLFILIRSDVFRSPILRLSHHSLYEIEYLFKSAF